MKLPRINKNISKIIALIFLVFDLTSFALKFGLGSHIDYNSLSLQDKILNAILPIPTAIITNSKPKYVFKVSYDEGLSFPDIKSKVMNTCWKYSIYLAFYVDKIYLYTSSNINRNYDFEFCNSAYYCSRDYHIVDIRKYDNGTLEYVICPSTVVGGSNVCKLTKPVIWYIQSYWAGNWYGCRRDQSSPDTVYISYRSSDNNNIVPYKLCLRGFYVLKSPHGDLTSRHYITKCITVTPTVYGWKTNVNVNNQ